MRHLVSLLLVALAWQAVVGQQGCPALHNIQHSVTPIEGDGSGRLFKIEFVADGAELAAFGGAAALEWVDLHFTLNPPAMSEGDSFLPVVNVRMDKNGLRFSHIGADALAVGLSEGDTVKYFFTYCIGGNLDCNTELFTFTRAAAVVEPQPILAAAVTAPTATIGCPALTNFEHEMIKIGANLYKLQFRVPLAAVAALNMGNLEWVDVHYTISDIAMASSSSSFVPALNFRMNKLATAGGDSSMLIFEYLDVPMGGLCLREGQKINYFFTYCIGGNLDCNTEVFEFARTVAPAPVVAAIEAAPAAAAAICPALHNIQHGLIAVGGGLYKFGFAADRAEVDALARGALEWVDLHYSINPTGATMIPDVNVRMQLSTDGGRLRFVHAGGEGASGVSLRGGDVVKYFFTYCIGGTLDCDTEVFSFTANN